MSERCAKQIFGSGSTFRGRPCSRKPVTTEDGERWCKVHAPSEQKRRNAARSEEIKAKVDARIAYYQKSDRIREATRDLILAVKEARHMGPLPEGVAYALKVLELAEA